MNSTNHPFNQQGGQRAHARSLRRFAPAALALGAFLALVCLSGCATASGGSNDFEPNQYNPSTGYPAIGGGSSWH
jgi:hypothetical protein